MSFDLPTLPVDRPGLLFAVLLAAVLVAPMAARRIRLPEIVVLLFVGYVIGPTGLGIVERAGVVATLGTVGLLYLMFVAGLELDIDDFTSQRRGSAGFGIATFVVPMALGTVTSLALGYGMLASLLLGSCWASHTLIAYPIFQRVGTVGNRAIAVSVGATIITDTAALLVLAVIARAHQGALTPLFWATLVPSLGLVAFGTLRLLPRLTGRFFSTLGQDRSLRFLFVMVALFGVASLFEAIGIEAIVGAFVAGLALNRSVPNRGPLMERIDFLGGTLFIPLFLLATGMLIDLSVLATPRTLVHGVVFTAVALVAKLLAAVLAGRLLRFTGPEIGAMFALSSAQAAATLAAIVVGLEIGLLDESTVNAVMLVILVTCLAAPAAASRYASQLPRPQRQRNLGDLVLVPMANPDSAPRLVQVASAFARADGGLVVPAMIVSPETERTEREESRQLEDRMVRAAQSTGVEARSILRIDASPAAGIAHTVVEQDASLLLMGWSGSTSRSSAVFGGVIDAVLSRTGIPTLLLFGDEHPIDRIVLIVDETVTTAAGLPNLDLAITAARVLAKLEGVPIEVITDRAGGLADQWPPDTPEATVRYDERRGAAVVRAHATARDLIVVPTIGDDAHLRDVVAPVATAAPMGASLLVALDTALRSGRAPSAAPPGHGLTVGRGDTGHRRARPRRQRRN
ncbi:MAG TPA: cation:proton antiporter [Egicoccus sp.]|nr:cation:proton antiporter [Egicoccus sp.]HSK22926.1 cation:proton antiporter [Egicoccus sp.]